jgi:ABC-type transport system substrate-binding protein/ABC-type dipeptide/oligopeptide/nickel transport system permease subunit
VDRHTYRVRIQGKYPQFVYWLAMPFFAPVPEEAERFYRQPGMAEKNFSLDWQPVGTGAYYLAENDPNRVMRLERNPHYREDFYPAEGDPGDREAGLLADAGKRLPMVDTVIYSLEKEDVPYWNKFLQGYYDASGVSSDSFDQAIRMNADGEPDLTPDMRERGILLATAARPSLNYMGFNMLDPVVGGLSERSRKLRQALSIAIDYDEFISIFLNGRGLPGQGPIPPGIFGHREGLAGINPVVFRADCGMTPTSPPHPSPQAGREPSPPPRAGEVGRGSAVTSRAQHSGSNQARVPDASNSPPAPLSQRGDCARFKRRPLEEAKQLLAEAGYPNGRDAKTGQPLTLYFDTMASGPEAKSRMDWFRKQFARLDIQLVIRATDYNRFQDKMSKGSAQIFEWGWNADYPDPENFLFLLYGPNKKVGVGGENAANYQNPAFDRLFEKMKDMDNGPERQAVIDEMVRLAREDAPWIYAFHPKSFGLRHGWVKNAKPNLMAHNLLKYRRVDPAARAAYQAAWNRPVLWPVVVTLALLAALVWPAVAAYRGGRRRRPMLNYVIRRLLYAIPILLGVNLLTFALFFMVNTPDDMARIHLGAKHVTPESIARWKSEHGYDKPLFFNDGAAGVDKARIPCSWRSPSSCSCWISAPPTTAATSPARSRQRMWPSLAIALPTFLVGLLAYISFALLLVFFRGTPLDTAGVVLCVALMSISGLFYVIGGQYLMGKLWHWFPISGYQSGAGCLEIPAHAGAGEPGGGHRRFQPLLPRPVHRGDRQGLRAHRPRQGPVRIARAVPPRAGQRHDPDPHRRGGGDAAPVPGQPDHRIVLRHPRPGQLHHRRDPGPGLRHRPFHGVPGFAALHRRPGADRHFLHAGGPAGEAGMNNVGIGDGGGNPVPALVRCADPAPAGQPYPACGAGAGRRWLVRHNDTFRGPLRQVMASPMGRFHGADPGGLCRHRLAGFAALRGTPAGCAGQGSPVQRRGAFALDALLTPLREKVEKTYSAPFATHLYAKETMTGRMGREVRDFPALKHGGAHLGDPEKDFWPDVPNARVDWGCWAGSVLGAAGLPPFWGIEGDLKRVPSASVAKSPLTPLYERGEPGRGRGARRVVLTLLSICLVVGLLVALAPHYHMLGTDKVGQDVLYLALKSVRTGLLIGTLTTLIMLPFALGLGIAAGYFGGRIDDRIQYLYTTLNSIPGRAAHRRLGAGGAGADRGPSRTVRHRRRTQRRASAGPVRDPGGDRLDRSGPPVAGRGAETARAGVRAGGAAFGVHPWPHSVAPPVAQRHASGADHRGHRFSGLVLAEAVLSYVGVGVDPAMISFGNMINGARLELAREPVVWWQLAAAFLFMFVLVLAANLFADQVRDALDPKSRGRGEPTLEWPEGREPARGNRRRRPRADKPVDGVSFEIGADECVALLGESGCGKSMTALALMRLLPEGGTGGGGRCD